MKPYFSELTVAREFDDRTTSETYQIGVHGGTVPGIREDGSSRQPAEDSLRRFWKDDVLSIYSGTYTGLTPASGDWTERGEVWMLDPEGRLHVSVATRSSTDVPKSTDLVYRRQ